MKKPTEGDYFPSCGFLCVPHFVHQITNSKNFGDIHYLSANFCFYFRSVPNISRARRAPTVTPAASPALRKFVKARQLIMSACRASAAFPVNQHNYTTSLLGSLQQLNPQFYILFLIPLL